ncbi:MAG TPA: hypothetical protein DIT32_02335 [Peptococcaceae bacterium]|nr:hypothetical protein [Peptococcaceae bacterium]
MIEMTIPGFGKLSIRHLILDYNGTLAKDGCLLEGIKERLTDIARFDVEIHIISADTHHTLRQQCKGLPVSIHIVEHDNVVQDKLELVRNLGAESCFAIGNGRNDYRMLKESKIGVCVIGAEGAFAPNVGASDLIISDICHGLDLLLHPNRLIASLRG